MKKNLARYHRNLMSDQERLEASVRLIDCLGAWLASRGRWLGTPTTTKETAFYHSAVLRLEDAALAFFGRTEEHLWQKTPSLEEQLVASLKKAKRGKKK